MSASWIPASPGHATRATFTKALSVHPPKLAPLQHKTSPLQPNLQLPAFIFNNFQVASPASLFLSRFCIVAGGWVYPSSSSASSKTLSACLSYLSPLLSITCALFGPIEPSQPLVYQSLAHSFPFNRGGCRSIPKFQIRKPILLISALLCFLLALTSSPAAAAQSPDQTEAPLANAKALFDKGNFTEADRTVRQFLQSHPDSADGHFLLGHILFREISAKWREEGKAEGEALLYNTGDLSGSLVAYRDAKAKESLEEFTAGAKYHVPSAFDLKIVALDYLLLKDNNDADHWLTRSLQADPRDAQAWYYLGRTKYGKGQFLEAIQAFEQCLKLEPRNIKAETNVGLSYEGLARADEAAQAFQSAIAWQAEKPSKDPEPFMELGHLYVNQNQPEKAVPYLTQSIAILPKVSKAHEELGKAYSLLNRFPEAQAELEKAIELTPQAPNLHCLLAPVYRKQGFAEKAKAEYDRCAALSGSHSTS